jgi:hypothetical protein
MQKKAQLGMGLLLLLGVIASSYAQVVRDENGQPTHQGVRIALSTTMLNRPHDMNVQDFGVLHNLDPSQHVFLTLNVDNPHAFPARDWAIGVAFYSAGEMIELPGERDNMLVLHSSESQRPDDGVISARGRTQVIFGWEHGSSIWRALQGKEQIVVIVWHVQINS